MKMHILPRQARDKHRENSKKGPFFLRDRELEQQQQEDPAAAAAAAALADSGSMLLPDFGEISLRW